MSIMAAEETPEFTPAEMEELRRREEFRIHRSSVQGGLPRKVVQYYDDLLTGRAFKGEGEKRNNSK